MMMLAEQRSVAEGHMEKKNRHIQQNGEKKPKRRDERRKPSISLLGQNLFEKVRMILL